MTTKFTAAPLPLQTVAADDADLCQLHLDILETHILTRLDGPTLASVSCASAQFCSLASRDTLWTRICNSRWPSTASPIIQKIISTFPNGSRSFFADSYTDPVSLTEHSPNTDSPSELISAVDIHYKGELILSKVIETEIGSAWFNGSPFRVDLLDPKETVGTRIIHPDPEEMCNMKLDMELSWIVIDRIGRRAMDISSARPVSVQRHWLSGEVQVRFATVLAGERGTAAELAQCGVVVTCPESSGGAMHVREVSLQVEDTDGMHLNGRDSLDILWRALEGRRGKGGRKGDEGKSKYEEYLERKRARKEKKMRAEGALDVCCVAFGVLAFASSAFFLLG